MTRNVGQIENNALDSSLKKDLFLTTVGIVHCFIINCHVLYLKNQTKYELITFIIQNTSDIFTHVCHKHLWFGVTGITINAAKLALFSIEVFDALLVLGIAASVRFYKMGVHLIMHTIQPMSGKFQDWPYKNGRVYLHCGTKDLFWNTFLLCQYTACGISGRLWSSTVKHFLQHWRALLSWSSEWPEYQHNSGLPMHDAVMGIRKKLQGAVWRM